MLGATFALVVVLGYAEPMEPAELVNQLGSTRYLLREAAEGELARLGRLALPALRVAKDSKDPEIRTRAASIIARIENTFLLQATPISLDFHQATLGQAVEAINRQSGLNLNFSPEEGQILSNRRLAFSSREPQPFWMAMDSLCFAAGLHHEPTLQNFPGTPQGTFFLFDRPAQSTGLISDCGPFRVSLCSVHFQSEVQLNLPRELIDSRGKATARNAVAVQATSPSNKQFFLQFLVAAEPRLSITQNGAVKLLTVLDDKNQNLLDSLGATPYQHDAGYFGINPTPTIRLRADLRYPPSPGRQIRLLRGTIPVIASGRKPDPAVVTLAESVGKSFRCDDVELTLLSHRPALDNLPAIVQVSIRPFDSTDQPAEVGQGEPLGYRADSTQQQLEILDQEGRPLSWFPSSTFYNGDESRLTLTVGSRGKSGVPTTLRYHGILSANTDVTFEFRDIPMP